MTPYDTMARNLRDALRDSEEFRDGSIHIPAEHAAQLLADFEAWDEADDAKLEGLTSGERDTVPLYSFEEAWDELVNKDDRTSPEEYPDMCLITREELRCYMQARQYAPAASPANHAGSVGEVQVRPFAEWHEDHGDVLWWKLPIQESPYVGSPLDLGRSMKVVVQIGFEEHDLPITMTGGWPFDEEDEVSLYWSPLPNARAIQAAALHPIDSRAAQEGVCSTNHQEKRS